MIDGDPYAGLPQWIPDIPELSFRPEAVAELLENEKLRKAFVRLNRQFFEIAHRLQGHPSAREVLTLLWLERKRIFRESWNDRLSHDAFGQCYSALRNIYNNAVARATGRPSPLRGVHDVQRSNSIKPPPRR